MEAEAWEARPLVQPSPHSSPDPVPTLALTGTQTRFSQEPADQTVVAGQRAVLPCVLLNYSGIVQWTKDGLALGMGQGLKGEWGSPAPSLPILASILPPTKSTGLNILSFPTTFLLWAVASPLPLLCESVSVPVPSSLSADVQAPQLCLSSWVADWLTKGQREAQGIKGNQ